MNGRGPDEPPSARRGVWTALLAAGLVLLAGAALAQETPPVGRPASVGPAYPLLYAAVIFLLVIARAFFAIAERVLLTVAPRRARLLQLAEEGNRTAGVIQRLASDPGRFNATLQVGITLTGFAIAALAAYALLAPLLTWPGPAPDWERRAALLGIVFLAAFVTLVFGEIVPKALAIRSPERWALLLARPVALLTFLFRPMVGLVLWISNLLARPFGGTAAFEAPIISEEELKAMVDVGEEQGVLDEGERQMIKDVFKFADTPVRKLMTPRIDIVGIEAGSARDQVVERIVGSGHSRLPVYQESLDDILGFVHAKDLLPVLGAGVEFTVERIMRPAHFVPETKKANELLQEFRHAKGQIAVVRDEYGGTAGLVTIEDLLEEIVGEIRDEYDVEEPEILVLSDRECLVDGLMTVDDVNEALELDLPAEDYDRFGGLVFGLLGHQATVGERVEWREYDFVVEEVEGRRIARVRVIKTDRASEEVP